MVWRKFAGFWVRFAAALIDGVIFGISTSVVGFLLGLIFGQKLLQSLSGISYILSFFLQIGYYVLFQASAGQTLGKKAMRIKVVNEKGSTPSIGVFFLREIIGKLVSAIILMIGYFMVIWDGKKQALHDKIAGTYVIRV